MMTQYVYSGAVTAFTVKDTTNSDAIIADYTKVIVTGQMVDLPLSTYTARLIERGLLTAAQGLVT